MMKNTKTFSFFFAIIPIIIGWTLYKQFNFETKTFENSGLASVYAVTTIISIILMIKSYRNQPEN